MRHVALLVVMCWALLPAIASIQLKVYDSAYKTTPVSGMAGVKCDWTQRAIFVTVVAPGPSNVTAIRSRDAARKQALTDARKQVENLLSSIQVTGYATLADVLNAHLFSQVSVQSLCASLRPVIESWDDSRRILTFTTVLPFSGVGTPGEIAARLLEFEQKSLANTTRIYAPEEMKIVKTVPAVQLSAGPYTGVIIDATGLGASPLLLPRLLAETGEEIWGAMGLSTQTVLEKGTAIYAPDIEAALATGRVGQNPLILRAVGAFGKARGDLVLRPEDVTLLTEQNAASRFLPALAVAILIENK